MEQLIQLVQEPKNGEADAITGLMQMLMQTINKVA